jgi:hypothetical protein
VKTANSNIYCFEPCGKQRNALVNFCYVFGSVPQCDVDEIAIEFLRCIALPGVKDGSQNVSTMDIRLPPSACGYDFENNMDSSKIVYGT